MKKIMEATINEKKVKRIIQELELCGLHRNPPHLRSLKLSLLRKYKHLNRDDIQKHLQTETEKLSIKLPDQTGDPKYILLRRLVTISMCKDMTKTEMMQKLGAKKGKKKADVVLDLLVGNLLRRPTARKDPQTLRYFTRDLLWLAHNTEIEDAAKRKMWGQPGSSILLYDYQKTSKHPKLLNPAQWREKKTDLYHSALSMWGL